ncbi:site-specific DNA-methyltransferase [Sphingomonas psychrotolerans]|uniref:Methyltransferase n=1 Tax=Sphingomonas psychrotolerans TaxID=1327635 RepID=A0ABU3N143_9SPHN|nr:site-specific DNA-methyltransferase [Sphingomonas psychrotolerans]MDT8758265.1 site-specific DNA-methyltransferase [Sphingomonas psychrotolerans]
MTSPTIIGPATLYLGDAYAIRPTLGFFDADVLDPPFLYNAVGAGKHRKVRYATKAIIAENMANGFDHQIISPLWAGGVVVFCHNDQLPEVGAHLKGLFRRFILGGWSKTNPMPVANKHYLYDTEYYFHAWNSGYHPVGSIADKRRFTSAPVASSKLFNHPTVKPAALMDKIVRNVAGASICDPFMGTGSTGVAAVRAGKRFVGIEHNPAHFETAVRRITTAFAEMERAA